MNFNNSNKMHPDDRRRLFVFLALAALLYFGYDAMILKPQRDAIAARKANPQVAIEQTIAGLENAPLPEPAVSRGTAMASSPRLKIDNGKLKGSIALRGGRLDDIALEEYFTTLEKTDNVVVLSPTGTESPRYVDYGWVAVGSKISLPGPDTLWQARGNTLLSAGNPVTLTWNNGAGLSFERTYAIDENYVISTTQKVSNASGVPVTLHPFALIAQRGWPQDMMRTWISHEGPIGYVGDKLHELKYQDLYKEGDQSFEAPGGWTGITEKYWLTAIIPQQGAQTKYTYSYRGAPPIKREKPSGLFQSDYTGPAYEIAPGESAETTGQLFVGPKKVLMLDEYEEKFNAPHLDLAVNFGWFWFFSRPFFLALHHLGNLTGNFGIAIILMTIAVRTAVFPLTNASYRSFAKMKKVTPQINKLREIHGDDRAGLQRAIMELYQREGVNPMAGCLPIFVQIPIFFALYKVLFITIEMRHAPFFGWIHDLSVPDPTTIFNLFGLIPWDPPSFLHVGAWPCLMLLAMLVQKKLNPPPQDQLQRDMANYFPFVITYIMANFASGLLVYWTLSAWIGVLQQVIIMRSLGVPIHLFGQSEEEEKLEHAVEKGPGVHPLVEMAEEDVEEALFGDDAEPKQISPPKPKKKKKKK